MNSEPNSNVVPSGAPPWITTEDIEETIRVWQPRSEKPLTPDDAVEILVNVRQLLTAMRDQEGRELRGEAMDWLGE